MIKCLAHVGDYAKYTTYVNSEDEFFAQIRPMYPVSMIVRDDVDVSNKYIVDGELREIPQRVSIQHVFNYTTGEWQYGTSLEDAKKLRWSKIKANRAEAEYAGFEWDGSRFDSDAISQQRLSGAVMLAQMDPNFTIDWTLEDDTTRTLNQAEMISVGVALGVHVQTGFAKGQALRAQIDTATTQEEVEAVVW